MTISTHWCTQIWQFSDHSRVSLGLVANLQTICTNLIFYPQAGRHSECSTESRDTEGIDTLTDQWTLTDRWHVHRLREACQQQLQYFTSVAIVCSSGWRGMSEADASFPDVLTTVDCRHVLRVVLRSFYSHYHHASNQLPYVNALIVKTDNF